MVLILIKHKRIIFIQFDIFIITVFHTFTFWEVSTVLCFRIDSRIGFWKMCPLRDKMKLDKIRRDSWPVSTLRIILEIWVVKPTCSWHYVWILELLGHKLHYIMGMGGCLAKYNHCKIFEVFLPLNYCKNMNIGKWVV